MQIGVEYEDDSEYPDGLSSGFISLARVSAVLTRLNGFPLVLEKLNMVLSSPSLLVPGQHHMKKGGNTKKGIVLSESPGPV